MQLWGVDFSSAPTARKPVVVALGVRAAALVRLQSVRTQPRMSDFVTLLTTPGRRLGAFDFAFGCRAHLCRRSNSATPRRPSSRSCSGAAPIAWRG